jgi:hypothetical protein
MEECDVECDVEETMAQFGGGDDPRLFIRLDPRVEGDDDLLSFN